MLLVCICIYYKLVYFFFLWGKIVYKEVCFGLKEMFVGYGWIKFVYFYKLIFRFLDVENWFGDVENLKGLG